MKEGGNRLLKLTRQEAKLTSVLRMPSTHETLSLNVITDLVSLSLTKGRIVATGFSYSSNRLN